MNPDGVKNESPDAITNRIFLSRVKQLALLRDHGDETRAGQVKEQILADIRSLPQDSVSIRDNRAEIKKALEPQTLGQRGGRSPPVPDPEDHAPDAVPEGREPEYRDLHAALRADSSTRSSGAMPVRSSGRN